MDLCNLLKSCPEAQEMVQGAVGELLADETGGTTKPW